jgi:hypothetical protein
MITSKDMADAVLSLNCRRIDRHICNMHASVQAQYNPQLPTSVMEHILIIIVFFGQLNSSPVS